MRGTPEPGILQSKNAASSRAIVRRSKRTKWLMRSV